MGLMVGSRVGLQSPQIVDTYSNSKILVQKFQKNKQVSNCRYVMGTVVGIVAAGDLEIEIGSDASLDAFLLLLLNTPSQVMIVTILEARSEEI